MNPHEQLITGLVLETIQPMPPEQRAIYLHALAALSSSDDMAANLEQLAQDCEGIASRHRQLVLDFKRRTEG